MVRVGPVQIFDRLAHHLYLRLAVGRSCHPGDPVRNLLIRERLVHPLYIIDHAFLRYSAFVLYAIAHHCRFLAIN